jgi:branched-chain amino acid transport system substrate-binding protein
MRHWHRPSPIAAWFFKTETLCSGVRVPNSDKTICFAGSICADERSVGMRKKGCKEEGDRTVKANEKKGDRTVKGKHFVAFVLAILVVTALLVAGCGSSEESTSTTATTSGTSTTGSTDSVSTTGPPATGEPIKIGLLYSATGMAAAASSEVVDALKLELKLLNAAGGIDGRPIEFVEADDGSDAQKGVVAATKLIQDDKVTAILGPFAMFVSSPVGLLAEKAGVPIIYLTPKSPADTTVQKYTFAVDYTVMGQMAMSLQMFQESGYKKWVGFAENMPGGAESLAALASMGTKAGITFINYDDTWDLTEMDLSPVVTKIAAAVKKEGADALYIGMNENQAPYICKGLRDLGVKVPIYTTANVGSQRLFALGPEPVEGLVFMGKATMDPSAIPDSAPTKPIAIEFIARFNAEYGKNPGLFSTLGYDAFAVLVDALKRGGTEQTKLRDALEATNELVTVVGSTPSHRPSTTALTGACSSSRSRTVNSST